jgi:hypothetical protein
MLALKTSNAPPPKRRRRPPWFVVLALLFVAALVGAHFRGRWLLKARARELAIRGEALDSTNLWPEISQKSVEFSNSLTAGVAGVTGSLRKYAGQAETFVADSSGKWHRGSQTPGPVIQGSSTTTSWEELAAAVEQNQNALRQLRELMKNPPSGMAYKLKYEFSEYAIPDFVSFRVGAQVLQAAALNDLHQGNLAGALDDMLAMRGFTRLYADDPGLVSLMIRIAILGIANNVCWDALQAKGWSDEQLQRLQTACEFDRRLLSRVPLACASERARRIRAIELFRNHSYEAWIAWNERLLKGWRMEYRTDYANEVAPRTLRQWLLHPLWSFCCADEETANYLQATEGDYQSYRRITEHQSSRQLADDLARTHREYRPPAWNWRFYTAVPFLDFSRIPGEYPYAPFGRAWQTVMKNLTVNELVIAAIAIKRYELRHDQAPANLTSLVPEFLPSAPRDLMDGGPLRYRNLGGTAFLLSSVGDDLKDDGGNTLQPVSDPGAQSPWAARDCVWPIAAE